MPATEGDIPKGVAVYDRPPPSPFRPAVLLPLLLGAAAAVAAGLHYFQYF